jgi:hypothetical protein
VIGNLFIVEFLGDFLSHHLFLWLSLHLGMSSFFLVSFLACLCLLAVGYVHQAAI